MVQFFKKNTNCGHRANYSPFLPLLLCDTASSTIEVHNDFCPPPPPPPTYTIFSCTLWKIPSILGGCWVEWCHWISQLSLCFNWFLLCVHNVELLSVQNIMADWWQFQRSCGSVCTLSMLEILRISCFYCAVLFQPAKGDGRTEKGRFCIILSQGPSP